MTLPDLAKIIGRHDATAAPSEAAHAAVLALLLVLLLAAGFSVVTQWAADGLRPPQVVTAE
jgi:hypothetical protein